MRNFSINITKSAMLASMILTLFSAIAFCAVATDPTNLSIGARYLAMGSSGVALPGDVNSIYSNPANLSSVKNWQIASMSGKLFDEYNYININGVYPTKYGNIGIGIVSASIGGAIPTKVEEDSSSSDLIYVPDPSLSSMDYYNNALLISYSNKLEGILNFYPLKLTTSNMPWMKEISYGFNAKILNAGVSGGGISQGPGTGIEMDFGIQGNTSAPWLSYGLTLKNMLPASLGGKLSFANGWEESYPLNVNIGLAANILGKESSFKSLGENNLKILADLNLEPTRQSSTPLFKVGVEWSPINLIALRVGLDQAMSGDKVANNLTAGIGVNYNGFKFDYAYHQFDGAYGASNSFFSIGYGMAPIIAPASDKKETSIIISTPSEVLTTFEASITIEGEVKENIDSLKINDKWVELGPNKKFKHTAELLNGKNVIAFESYNKAGKFIGSKNLKVLRLAYFKDVNPYYFAYDQINQMGTLGLINGYSDGKFKPAGYITRIELFNLLSKAYDSSPKKSEITISSRADISNPDEILTRVEGLAMIAKLSGISEESYTTTIYRDINANHWASKIIAGAQKEGMLFFIRGNFNPNKKLTRAEAIQMFAQTKLGKSVIDDLLNFDRGYDVRAVTKLASSRR